MSLLKPLAAAASIIAMSAGVAAAGPAVSETNLNMRSGPGTDHAVVDVIPAGATVEVLDCAGTWCRVAYAGATGYASRSYLAMGAGGVTVGRANTAAPTVSSMRTMTTAMPTPTTTPMAPRSASVSEPMWDRIGGISAAGASATGLHVIPPGVALPAGWPSRVPPSAKVRWSAVA